MYHNIVNQKGIIPLIFLLLIAAAVVASGAGYYIHKSKSNSGKSNGNGTELSEPWDAYDNSQAVLDELEWVENYIADNDVIYDEDEQAADFEMSQEQVKESAQIVLDSSFCGASLEDVRHALQSAAQAQSVGLEDLGDELIKWAKNAFTSNVTMVAPSWANNPSEEAMYDWLYYWGLSGMLGMENLMDMILDGNINLSSWIAQNCSVGQGIITGTPLDAQIKILLAKDYCMADVENVRDGLKLVERIQLLAKERDDEVFKWSQDGFTALVAKNHEDWDASTRLEHAGIAEMLDLQSLSNDLKTNRVDLDDWLETNCEKKGAYSITFGDQTYTKTIGDSTQTYKITNAHAYTCDGIFSRWEGTMDFSMELSSPGYPAQISEGKGQSLSFILVDPQSAKAGATLAKLEGTQITLWVPIASVIEGGSNLTGNYTEGASECN